MDEISSLQRLYLACDAERDQAIQELDLALADLRASEFKRAALVAEKTALEARVAALTAEVARLQHVH